MAPTLYSIPWQLLLLLSLVLQTAAQLDDPTSSLTTLPPAQPTGNVSDPCAFEDRNNMIDRVEEVWQEYNVSLLVATCDNVCLFVYGAGNPDVSGIGVGCLLGLP